MRNVTLLLAALLVLACGSEPLGPEDGRSVSQPELAVVARSDSLAKGGYVSWQDGGLSHWVFVSEVLMPGSGMQVWLAYGAYDPVTYEAAFYGYGYISPNDVTGSAQGTLQLRTSTDPSTYPTFVRVDHEGGAIEISWRAVPQTAWRLHDVGAFEWGGLVFRHNTVDTSRDATVTGDVLGSPIPAAVTGWLTQNVSASMILQPGN